MMTQTMTPDAMVAFFVFALVAAVTPGPSNVMVLAAGARAGLIGGLPCVAGVVAGMALLIASAAFGLGSVVSALPAAMVALRWGGAALLLWLAWKIALRATDGGRRARRSGGLLARVRVPVGEPEVVDRRRQRGSHLWRRRRGRHDRPRTADGRAVRRRRGAELPAVAGLRSALQRALTDARRARVFNAVMGVLLAASVVFVVA